MNENLAKYLVEERQGYGLCREESSLTYTVMADKGIKHLNFNKTVSENLSFWHQKKVVFL